MHACTKHIRWQKYKQKLNAHSKKDKGGDTQGVEILLLHKKALIDALNYVLND